MSARPLISLKGQSLEMQISGVRAFITDNYPPGSKCPTTAEFAQLGMNAQTATSIMSVLRGEGLVDYIKTGSSSYGYIRCPFTPDQRTALYEEQKAARSKAIRERSNKSKAICTNSRELRQRLRDSLLQAVITEGIDRHLITAIREGDTARMHVIEKACELVGVKFSQSEEAVQLVEKHTAAALAKAGAALAAVNVTFQSATDNTQRIEAEIVEAEVS